MQRNLGEASSSVLAGTHCYTNLLWTFKGQIMFYTKLQTNFWCTLVSNIWVLDLNTSRRLDLDKGLQGTWNEVMELNKNSTCKLKAKVRFWTSAPCSFRSLGIQSYHHNPPNHCRRCPHQRSCHQCLLRWGHHPGSSGSTWRFQAVSMQLLVWTALNTLKKHFWWTSIKSCLEYIFCSGQYSHVSC